MSAILNPKSLGDPQRLDLRLMMLSLILLLSVTASAQIPVAELPRIKIDSLWDEPKGGTAWRVHTAEKLVSALQSAAPGDLIVLDAGSVYTGNFTVPPKANPNKKWIYVTSSDYAKLPPPGTRVSPTDASKMPKIVTPGATGALKFADGANYWRFVGVEIYSNSNYHPSMNPLDVFFGYSLVDKAAYPGTSDIPNHIYFDRCYIHGDATHDLQEGVTGNFSYFAVVDSYISEIHAKGIDTQAVVAYITPGPIKLVNNHLEGAGENVMIGGAGNGRFGYVPSDIEIRNNYFYKPLTWVAPSLNGTWVVKNLLEFKAAARAIVDHNIFQNSWAAGQTGQAVLFTIRTTSGGPTAVVDDIVFTNNALYNVIAGFNTLGADSGCRPPNCTNAGESRRVVIYNNLITLYDATQPGGGPSQHYGLITFNPGNDYPKCQTCWDTMYEWVVQHNTIVPYGSQTCWQSIYFSAPGVAGNPPWMQPLTSNIWILDNVLCKQPTGANSLTGMAALNNYMAEPSTQPNDITRRFYGNVMLARDTAYTRPTGNTVASSKITYVNPAIGDYTLLSPKWTNTSDGRLAGVNVADLPVSTGP